MTDPHRERDVLDAVVSLADALLDDFDLVDLLGDLVQRCTALLDVQSAGLLLVDPAGSLQLLTATSVVTRDLEVFQLQRDEGPCLDAFAAGEVVRVPDLSREGDRWPHFAAAAIEAGLLSVHAVPMRAAGATVGVMGLFGTAVGDLNSADLALAQALAHLATVAIVHQSYPAPDVVAERLHSAFAARTVVEQARGLVCARLGVGGDEALDLLRLQARASGRHLSDVARDVMADRAARAAVLDALTHRA